MQKIFLIVGARPNFIKMAPLYFVLKRNNNVNPIIIHTGQHYDYEMSQAFFKDLDLPEPLQYLNAGSGTHAQQTANIMMKFEKVLIKDKPQLVIVFGDVNSTLACSITAKKYFFKIAHVEAGLRSFDMSMPEEINRKVTDSITDLFFTPSLDGNKNLLNEGVSQKSIYFVGNIMIDSLVMVLNRVDKEQEEKILNKYDLKRKEYALVTLHRPKNVDEIERLKKIMDILNKSANKIPIVFPIHPRTKKNLGKGGSGIFVDEKLKITGPLTYNDFIVLEKNTKFVLTDSGGIQEETTFLHIPCLTLRNNTERPITISEGTNELVDIDKVETKIDIILSDKWKKGIVPELWDGKTAERIGLVIQKEI